MRLRSISCTIKSKAVYGIGTIANCTATLVPLGFVQLSSDYFKPFEAEVLIIGSEVYQLHNGQKNILINEEPWLKRRILDTIAEQEGHD